MLICFVLIIRYIRFVKLHRNIVYDFIFSSINLRYLTCKLLIISYRYWMSEYPGSIGIRVLGRQ